MRAASAVLLALSVSPAAAQTSSVTKLFEQFGLFGTWAIDCGRSPSVDNPRAMVSRPQGRGPVIEKDDAGPGTYINRYAIVAAKRLNADMLAVKVLYSVGKKETQLQDQIWRVHDGSWRTLFNKPKGDNARVKDGIVVGSGTETPVLHRCEDPPVKHRAVLHAQTPHFPG